MNGNRLRSCVISATASFVMASVLGIGCTPQSTGGTNTDGTGGASTATGGSGGNATSAGSGGSSSPGTGGSTQGGTGGVSATGGGSPTGGVGSGGATDSGGTTGSGGISGSGGSVGTGGTTGSGGAGAGGRGGTGSGGRAATAGTTGTAGIAPLPDPGSDGDGDSMVGPSYTPSSDLNGKGNPKGKSFSLQVTSTIFDGKDTTLNKTPVNVTRTIQVYVPAMYKDGTPAPLLVIQDGPGELGQVSNALDNLTISTDPMRKLPAFVVVAVPSGGNDSIGSERGLEYDTMSDRYARYIDQEVLPAVATKVKASYPNFTFTKDPSGRGTLGCSSGGAAAFSMAWFRPDLFSRAIGYSTTLVAQQDPKSPEAKTYPHGDWDYHSDLEVIKNDTTGREKLLRIFINANQNDLNSGDRHGWLMANQKTAAALKAKGFHYKFVEGMGVGHCDGSVQSATLADALVWVWRGYVPTM